MTDVINTICDNGWKIFMIAIGTIWLLSIAKRVLFSSKKTK
jgi:hypothetical protein